MYALPWQLAVRTLRGYDGSAFWQEITLENQEAANAWALAELRRESGQDFGLDADRWQAWFERHDAEEIAEMIAAKSQKDD